MQKTRLMSKSHSKNEEKGEAQFRKNRKFAEIDPHFAHSGRSGCCLRASPAASVDRSIYFHPQITPTHEAISTSRSHCPAEPERRRTNTYIHRQAHGGARRKIGHHRTPHRDGKLSNLPLTDEGEKKSFKGTGKANLTPGNLPGIAFWMASFAKSVDMKAEGYVTADSLNFALDFQVPRMPVAMKVRFGNWAVTGLRTAVNDAQTAAVYTLDGRRLRALPARGGVYIVGGRKVVR